MEKSTIEIRNDIRFFTLFALLNGPFEYREEYGSNMTKERIELIDELTAISCTLDDKYTKTLKAYWDSRKLHPWWYVYYTAQIKIQEQFTFENCSSNKDYDEILEMMDGFEKLLQEFYVRYSIQEMYNKKYKYIIDKYITTYNPQKIIDDRNGVHEYLGIEKIQKSPKIIIVPLPFESQFSGYCVVTDEEIYILESKGAQNEGLNIHEYLHFFVNSKVDMIDDLYKLPIANEYRKNREKEYVRTSYDELNSFISENIVRAIDHRISNHKRIHIIDFNEFNKNGLSLIEYFYYRLEDYENEKTKYQDIYEFIDDAIRSFQI